MLALAMLLLLQGGTLKTGTASDYELPIGFRVSGTVVVGQNEPVGLIDISLTSISGRIDVTWNRPHTVRSFADGKFRFEDVQLGTYMIEVTDSRFNLYRSRIIFREADDTTNEIVVRLTRNGESGVASVPASDPYRIDEATLAKIDVRAIDEFNKGVDAIRNPAKNNPPDAYFKRATIAAPDFYQAHLLLGLELQKQKKTDQSEQAIERASELRPDEARPLSLLGQLYSDGEKFQKVIDVLLKVDQLGKMSARDQFNLGTAYFRLDRLPEAQKYLLAAINSGNDTDPAPFIQLHNVFMKMRAGGPALEVLDDYLRLFPNDPSHSVMLERAKQMRKVIVQPPRP